MMTHKKIISALAALLAAVLLTLGVFAAGSIDLSRDVSLTISYRDGNTPLSGAEFSIYLVAETDENGELTVTGDFAGFNVDIRGKNDEAWRTLAATLEAYVLRDRIQAADSGSTDGDGLVSFPHSVDSLKPGLYLVLGSPHMQDGRWYYAAPFMVMLPGMDMDANQWIYDVAVSAKHESHPIPDEPGDGSHKVIKVWDDEGGESLRPEKITVKLIRNGEVYDTIELSDENSWRYSWTLPDNGEYWTVAETEIDGYTVELRREGDVFIITNTREEETPDEPQPTEPPDDGGPKLPQTGQLWWPAALLAAAGLLLLVLAALEKRRNAR